LPGRSTKGPPFTRNRFFFQKTDPDLDPAKAPRIIKTCNHEKGHAKSVAALIPPRSEQEASAFLPRDRG